MKKLEHKKNFELAASSTAAKLNSYLRRLRSKIISVCPADNIFVESRIVPGKFHSAILAMAGNNPTQIFAEDVQEEKGENARLSAFVGAIAVGDLVKCTLGPKGMDKILQSA